VDTRHRRTEQQALTYLKSVIKSTVILEKDGNLFLQAVFCAVNVVDYHYDERDLRRLFLPEENHRRGVPVGHRITATGRAQ